MKIKKKKKIKEKYISENINKKSYLFMLQEISINKHKKHNSHIRSVVIKIIKCKIKNLNT